MTSCDVVASDRAGLLYSNPLSLSCVRLSCCFAAPLDAEVLRCITNLVEFVCRSGVAFEETVRSRSMSNPLFSWLCDPAQRQSNEYLYYQHMLQQRGIVTDVNRNIEFVEKLPVAEVAPTQPQPQPVTFMPLAALPPPSAAPSGALPPYSAAPAHTEPAAPVAAAAPAYSYAPQDPYAYQQQQPQYQHQQPPPQQHAYVDPSHAYNQQQTHSYYAPTQQHQQQQPYSAASSAPSDAYGASSSSQQHPAASYPQYQQPQHSYADPASAYSSYPAPQQSVGDPSASHYAPYSSSAPYYPSSSAQPYQQPHSQQYADAHGYQQQQQSYGYGSAYGHMPYGAPAAAAAASAVATAASSYPYAAAAAAPVVAPVFAPLSVVAGTAASGSSSVSAAAAAAASSASAAVSSSASAAAAALSAATAPPKRRFTEDDPDALPAIPAALPRNATAASSARVGRRYSRSRSRSRTPDWFRHRSRSRSRSRSTDHRSRRDPSRSRSRSASRDRSDRGALRTRRERSLSPEAARPSFGTASAGSSVLLAMDAYYRQMAARDAGSQRSADEIATPAVDDLSAPLPPRQRSCFPNLLSSAQEMHVRSQLSGGSGESELRQLDSSNLGHRMLRNMGWEEGTGLGKSRNGRLQPVQAVQRKQGAGIGANTKPEQILPTDDGHMHMHTHILNKDNLQSRRSHAQLSLLTAAQ